ncbi:MAG: prepilin-type N-terminal cleavage/methylation domain-containing protein [Caldisericia bacterium]|nr:prepilin-type N-terminal cleavage/methylation domain-containing protein [Caldisericia bacterium]
MFKKLNSKINKGYTLIELITTITIISILSYGIFTLSPTLIATQRLKNDAFQLVNDLREVQERARAQLEKLKINFYVYNPSTPELNNVYVFELRENAIQKANNEGKSIVYIINNTGEFQNIVVRKFSKGIGFPYSFGYTKGITTDDGLGSANSVVFGTQSSPTSYFVSFSFNEWGNPSQGGHINLISKNLYGKTRDARGNKLPKVITIYITPATGRIRFIGPQDWK